MDLQNLQQLPDAVEIGRVYLENAGAGCLEAFSGNALYCWRGMPTMKKYKTVKEVCDLTSLTRKHLYYFHHERVVQAVAYANYSVAGYDGYKLYDDAAVEKLQQIALYYQLGLKRNEIKDIMLAPDYDSNRILHTLLTLEREKKLHTERRIAALEYLVLAGTKNGVSGSLRRMSLDDLGRVLLAVRKAPAGVYAAGERPGDRTETFMGAFDGILSELAAVEPAELESPTGNAVIGKLFNLCREHFGNDCVPFVLGLFMSVLGEGSIAQELTNRLAPAHGWAVIQYMIDHPHIIGYPPSPTGAGDINKE